MLKIDEILEIIKAVNQSAINRFELEQEETRLVIAKDGGTVLQKTVLDQSNQVTAAALPDRERQNEPPNAASEEKYHQILAPMIGTFYAASEPGAEPFVKVGQKVNAGSIVCVLEAMKLFNEIEAGIAGEIIEVLAKDGAFVEYGQPLFLVRREMIG